jgi:hypothetical protein
MALATTIQARFPMGNKICVIGKGVLSGTTNTGDVTTGLAEVEFFVLETSGNAQKGTSVYETLPLSGGNVTVYTEANDATFYFMAIGHN